MIDSLSHWLIERVSHSDSDSFIGSLVEMNAFFTIHCQFAAVSLLQSTPLVW